MTSVFQFIIKSKNINNAFWIIAEQVFRMGISFVVGILSVRYLGASNYGTLNYTASFVSFFDCVATLGMEGVVIKKIIEYPQEEGEYLGGCIFLRIISSICSVIMIELTISILNPNEPLKLLLGLIQATQLIWRAWFILDAWFQRYSKSKYVSIGKLIASVIVAGYRIFLLFTKKPIIWFAFIAVISEAIISLIVFIFYNIESKNKIVFSISYGMIVLKESYHFILSNLMVAVYSQMDRIMLGKWLGDQEVGYYSTASTISSMWLIIPLAIINSFRPIVLELKENHSEYLYMKSLEQLYSFLIWMGIVISLVVSLLSGFIVTVLYGDDFIPVISTLRICIWYELFAVIGTARGIWVLAENKNKYVKYYLFIGALTNVLLNYFWIPSYGMKGAAFATLITQIITSLIAPLLFKETRIHTKIVIDSLLLKWYFKHDNKNGES